MAARSIRPSGLATLSRTWDRHRPVVRGGRDLRAQPLSEESDLTGSAKNLGMRTLGLVTPLSWALPGLQSVDKETPDSALGGTDRVTPLGNEPPLRRLSAPGAVRL